MWARNGPYSYRTFVGGVVALCPLQLRLSERVFRPQMYSVRVVGMSPKRLTVVNRRLGPVTWNLLTSLYERTLHHKALTEVFGWMLASTLGGHPKPAIRGHLKTGQRDS